MAKRDLMNEINDTLENFAEYSEAAAYIYDALDEIIMDDGEEWRTADDILGNVRECLDNDLFIYYDDAEKYFKKCGYNTNMQGVFDVAQELDDWTSFNDYGYTLPELNICTLATLHVLMVFDSVYNELYEVLDDNLD